MDICASNTPVRVARVRCANRSWLTAILLGLALLTEPVAVWAADANPDVSPVADLAALERAFQQVVERVSPSVVGIRARRRQVVAAEERAGQRVVGTVDELVVTNGSGTIIRADGLVLTNEHVVRNSEDIEVILFDGQARRATVRGADARSDLAVLKLDTEGLPAAQMCDWGSVARGQWSLALGNPYGLCRDGKLSVSVGVVSNINRRLPGLGEADDRLYPDMLQTTAAIYPGNSGGPLFNIRGELLAVVTAVHTRTADDEGLGFAIPLNPAKRRVIEHLLEGKPVQYGYLGVSVRNLELDEARRYSLDPDGGVVVEQLEPKAPAAAAGVQVGDILTHYEGQLVQAPMHLADLVGQTPAGQKVELKILRDGRPHRLHAVIDVRDTGRVSWLRGEAVVWRGMRLAEITAEAKRQLKKDLDGPGVVVVDVLEGSAADRAHIRIGDVIEQIQDTQVGAVPAFLQAARGREGAVRLAVRKRGTIEVAP